MSSFSESSLVKKLSDLNHSQQSIQTLSLWLIHHRKHAKSIVDIWFKTLKTEDKQRKLVFFYLANDVVQNSKKKGPEYNQAFQSVIVDAYKHAYKLVDEKTAQSMNRLVIIWAERNIFGKDLIHKLKKAINKGEKRRSRAESAESESSSKGSGSKPQTPDTKEHKKEKAGEKEPEHKSQKETTNGASNPTESRDPRRHDGTDKEKRASGKRKDSESEKKASVVKRRKSDQGAGSLKDQIAEFLATHKREDREVPEAEDLVKAINDLEHAASFDAGVREKIAALPPEVSDAASLSKVNDRSNAEVLKLKVIGAVDLLDEYNGRLRDELDERKRMAIMLSDFIAYQKDHLNADEAKLQDVKGKLDKVSAVRKELESHITSLPDFSLLPNFNVGLRPLPSAGDLFSSGEH